MNKGFTLVELIAVIAILGILATITTPAYGNVSKNIKTRNYTNKKNTIKYQTIAYVDKYYKDIIYNGKKNVKMCFTVDDLIHNSIISSDNDKEEYIENNLNNEKYIGTKTIIYITYDESKMKLKAVFLDERISENSSVLFTDETICDCSFNSIDAC